MVLQPIEILNKYWAYENFREPQEQIIQSVINGNDTLAVLATGAGKSLCYQIPAIYLGGTTLVVSPLIALMNDQVQKLKSIGINAFVFHSELSKSDQNDVLAKVSNMDYALLYISPEKLQSANFQSFIHKLHIRLVAIDEAHCVSQWGYDFRPEYLKISEAVCEIDCVKIALTASATPIVQKDIIEKLSLNNHKQFITSTFRKNLNYKIIQTEDKESSLFRLLKNCKGSTIVYTRSRKLCHELAKKTTDFGIKSQFYHAGLSRIQRHTAQDEWINGGAQIIFATNAFGMGIDKADVRNVIHFGAPNSIEAYYQEAGRAGRDGKESDVTILTSPKDKIFSVTQIEQVYQPIETVKIVFQSLCNMFQLAEGSMTNGLKKLDIEQLKIRTKLDFNAIHYSLKLMDLSGIIRYNEDYFSPSKLMILGQPHMLFALYENNFRVEQVLKSLIRLYGSEIYEEEQLINEYSVAKMSNLSVQELGEVFQFLTNSRTIKYFKGTDQPVVQFLIPRPPIKSLPINQELIKFLKDRALQQHQDIYRLIEMNGCKQQFLSEYFGNELPEPCGTCSSCAQIDWDLKDKILEKIQEQGKLNLIQIKNIFAQYSNKDLAKIIEFLMYNGLIHKDINDNFVLK